MSEAEPEEWSPEGLCEQFWDVDRKMHDRRFAFILGAGASVQSGIPAAGALVQRWLEELHRRLARGVPFGRWATAEALEIPGFSRERAASFYSQVFARRFRHQPDEGYADLEDIMQGKDPSFGYSVLAHVLAETRHKLVITTNFDNLVGEALSIFTGTAPLVCGHESLANFIRVVPRRPVVVKIHRDLLMAPMNHADEIATLQAAWVDPLTRVFSHYTPIVVGYGGNDGSLMGFLNGLPAGAIPGGIFWCYYGPAGPPGPEIRRLVARHRGALVPIEGFDELMLRLSARLRIPLLDQVIEAKARARVDNYRRRVEELQARLFPPAEEPTSAAERGDAGPSPVPEDSEPVPGSELASAGGGSAPPMRPSPAAVPSAVSKLSVRSSRSPAPEREPDERGAEAARSLSLESHDQEDSFAASPTATAPDRAGVEAPRGWRTTGPMLSLPGAGEPLRWALQQVAAEGPAASPWSALVQARGEPDRARALALLRAALERFPEDPELNFGLVERLLEVPSASSVREAIALLDAILRDDPDSEQALRHLSLLHAWRRDLPRAEAALARAWRLVWSPPAPAQIALAAFIAGLLARLGQRDDARSLAILKGAAAARVPVGRHLPYTLVADLLPRLDPSSQALYRDLLAVFAGRLPRGRVLHPRFAAIPPADLDALAVDDLP